MDADDVLELQEELVYAQLVEEGTHTRENISDMKAAKKNRENLQMCNFIIQSQSWLTDDSCTQRDVYLCCAAALEGLNRRATAIARLSEAREALPGDPKLMLASARLLFKDDRKAEALALVNDVCSAFEAGAACTKETAADAFNLAGWFRIHDSDHSGAYAVWSVGSKRAPHCTVLARQHIKRQCWDCSNQSESPSDGLVGNGAQDLTLSDLEAFTVVPELVSKTVALALFNPEKQKQQLVFRTKVALLTEAECARVVELVDAFHEDEREGQWGTVRNSTVKTTDVAVEDIPALRSWLRVLLQSRLYPTLATAFPELSNGSSFIDSTSGHSRMRVHDAFIVRYDAERDGSVSLPEHMDTSVVSVILSLNSVDAFKGGGTWFEALGPDGAVVSADVGCAVLFAGPMRHAGFPIHAGTRFILVLFLYVEGFKYGDCISEYGAKHPEALAPTKLPAASSASPKIRPSGDTEGGYVVYNQTVELVNALNRSSDDINLF
jgi:hypothetical protein